MTGIFAFKNNDNEKNLNETNDVNGTMDAIVANLESASKLTKASKPIKVNDINQVMDNIDYVVSKNSSKSRSSAKEDVNIGPKKGTKAWESWWKKKKAVNGDLLNAAQIGDFEKVKSLLDKDIQKEFVANIKFQGLDNFTALHFAAQGGHYEICEFLIENGCDVEARSNMGRTPLHLAAISGLSNILMLLLTNGADINSQDEDMYSALHHASEGGNTECVKLLVEKGADVTLKNNIGSSPNDISQNIDVRSLIEQYSDKEEIITDSLARRSEMGGVILRNDRKNYVERLMGRFQKVDKYLKETKNGSEEALIESIEKQQKQREEDRKRQRGMRQVKTEVENKKKKKEGRFERNKDKFLQIVQLEMKMKEELRGFGIEQDEAGPALFNPIGRLGRGSFGEVYLVEKLPEGDQYAMKILHKRRIMGQNLVRYARTERDVLSYFAHPFIVSIKYAFQTPEKLYMILEYCPGGDLGSVLKREKKLTEERAKLYLSEIILAIETLHQKDIIFRDLKPDNVVLDAEGHAMLTDFGLSKEGVTNNSSAKSFCGSVAYLAPEVLRRQGHGKSVDWYLVGVLLYEMLCGIPPYFSSNKDQMFKNIKSGPLRMPERFSKETKDFIVKLLNKNPSKRLGAGKGDAEELKQHPFFEGVNWKDVLERKQKMPKPVIREIKKSTVNLTDIVYGEYAGVGRVASSKEVEYHKALQKRGQTVKDTADADDLDRNKIPGWSFIGSPSN
mmetsp:Transcript_25980/g.25814  ORF Transcript_25980/g.25814 Transcript_25980/m.25814 type:complete len:731 (-) Transcript_25980:62-2254(-)